MNFDPTAAVHLCVYCWPASVRSSQWDEHGLPCCSACAGKPDRQSTVPSFVLRDIRRTRLDTAA